MSVNLRYPKFDWISEMIAVKQGMSSLISMFTAMAVVALAAVLYGTVFSKLMAVELYIALYSLLICAASAALVLFLKTRGGSKFAALSA